jgi:hypothetical protein
MRINPLIIFVAAVAIVIILYILALNSNTKTSSELKEGSFALYSFNIQLSDVSGTYRWEVISTIDDKATVLEQITVNSTVQNYTSYLDLKTGVITRERVSANGTLREPLCFMMTDPAKISQCPYYSPLRIDGDETAFGRSGVRAVPDNSQEYVIFDRHTGIMLKAQYGMNDIASVYEIEDTNVF